MDPKVKALLENAVKAQTENLTVYIVKEVEQTAKTDKPAEPVLTVEKVFDTANLKFPDGSPAYLFGRDCAFSPAKTPVSSGVAELKSSGVISLFDAYLTGWREKVETSKTLQEKVFACFKSKQYHQAGGLIEPCYKPLKRLLALLNCETAFNTVTITTTAETAKPAEIKAIPLD